MKRKIGIVLGIMMLASLACDLSIFGGQSATVDANAVMTAAAQTIAASGSGMVGVTSATSTFTIPAPVIPSSVPTIAPTVTQAIPCNQATYTEDVTIPDGTSMNFGQTFTKTWRIKNTGSCIWTSGYSLVFDHGDQMGGPASQQLTPGTVPPGGTLDISINLTAPSSVGSYRGYWRFREPGGATFILTSGYALWADIKVVTP